MIPLRLAWTLLTVSLWTSGSSQIIVEEPVKDLYHPISSSVTVECDCSNIACESVLWFRSISSQSQLQYLGKNNNADRSNYGPGVDSSKFKFSKRGNTFVLRVNNVSKEDTGAYSCILKDKKNTDFWKPGSVLWPGVTAPTPPPVTKPKPPRKPKCSCNKSSPQNSCGALVLWPLVGLTAGLGLGLLCVLCYFNQLPKKCRHHFQKKPQMPR